MQRSKKYKFQIAFCNFIAIFMSYNIFLFKHYSVDSYNCYFNSDIGVHIRNGRYVSYLLFKLASVLHINLVNTQTIFTFIFILTLTLFTTKLALTVYSLINKNDNTLFYFIDLAILVSFVNVFILEWFLYPEIMLVYACAITLCLSAVIVICKNQNIKHIVLSVVLLLLSLFSYQIVLPLFVIFGMIILALKHDFTLNKMSFKENFIVLSIGGGSSILTVIVQKLVNSYSGVVASARTAQLNMEMIGANIKKLASSQGSIWFNGEGFMFKYVFAILGLVLSAAVCYGFLHKSINKKIYLLLAMVVSYFIIFAPHLVVETQWYAPRTLVAFFCFFTFLFIIVAYIYRDDKKRLTLFGCLAGLFLLINIIKIQDIGINTFCNNKLDQLFSNMIQTEINAYEEANKVKITKISIINDSVPAYFYPEIKYVIYDTNIKAFSSSFGAVEAINYYNSENYIKVPMKDSIFDAHFKDRNWNTFNSKEQMVFEGDTLYCVIN